MGRRSRARRRDYSHGMSMRTGRAGPPPTKGKSPAQIRAEKILLSLGYGVEHTIKFQQHWNYVVASGMISGHKLATDGVPGPKTRAALDDAWEYMDGKPKDWMYYVHKAIDIGPKQSKVRMPATRPVRHRRRR